MALDKVHVAFLYQPRRGLAFGTKPGTPSGPLSCVTGHMWSLLPDEQAAGGSAHAARVLAAAPRAAFPATPSCSEWGSVKPMSRAVPWPGIPGFALGLSSLGLEAVKEKCQLLVTLGSPRFVLCPQTAIPSTLGFPSPVTSKGRETRRDSPQASRRSAGACGRTGTRPARGAGQAAGTAVQTVPAGPVSS